MPNLNTNGVIKTIGLDPRGLEALRPIDIGPQRHPRDLCRLTVHLLHLWLHLQNGESEYARLVIVKTLINVCFPRKTLSSRRRLDNAAIDCRGCISCRISTMDSHMPEPFGVKLPGIDEGPSVLTRGSFAGLRTLALPQIT